MPLQNRVTPQGEIVAIAQRGLFTGNRGIIHDPATRTLGQRRWAGTAWIICRCEFRGRRRTVMGGRSWTELFFLDEATALAAGHRPCFYCRRADAERFRAAWSRGNQVPPPPAREIDRTLHAERLDGRVKRRHPLPGPPPALPDGAMVESAEGCILIAAGRAFLWEIDGYHALPAAPEAGSLLTPPSTLRALAAGYRPVLHASCGLD